MDEVNVTFSSESGTLAEFSTTSADADKVALVEKVTTKLGTGHESAQVNLARDAFKRFDDIDLLYSVEITGKDGFQIFKGDVTGIPPESNRLTVNASGRFSILKDRPGCSEIYADKSMDRWGGIPLNRQAGLLTGNISPQDGTPVGGRVKLALAFPPWTSPGLPVTAMWYTAPADVGIGSIYVSYYATGSGWNTGDANFAAYVSLVTDDSFAAYDQSSDLAASAPSAVTVATTTSTRRFAELYAGYNAGVGTADSTERALVMVPTVYGTHGVSSLTPDAVIKNIIDRWCPGVTYDSDSITAHPFVFSHLVFEKQSPADMIAVCNSVANWDINVWGDTFYFGPEPSLNDPDYILSLDEGDTLEPTGANVAEDRPVNFAQVFYEDALTGRDEVVTGDDDDRLVASDPEHPCNREGRTRVLKVDISGPCDEDQAIQIGSLALAEQQVPSRSGKGSARGTLRTAAGERVPVWHLRAGDVVRYAHESIGRQVQATTYQPALSQVDIEFDDRAASLSAMLARMGVALSTVGSK